MQKANSLPRRAMARLLVPGSRRLLSVGDRVKYVCGEVASVVGFDADGDVIVLKQDGRRATWFAHCAQVRVILCKECCN